jgi:hypothetical protein
MAGRVAVSNILAMLLLISLSVVGAGAYYLAVASFMKPQPQLSSQVAINAGASGFSVIDAQITNVGGVPFSSVTVSITGPSSSQLQITYSALVAANGGETAIVVRGLSGGPYSAASSSTSVSGNLVAAIGSNYIVTVQATLTNGGTYRQAYAVTAQA